MVSVLFPNISYTGCTTITDSKQWHIFRLLKHVGHVPSFSFTIMYVSFFSYTTGNSVMLLIKKVCFKNHTIQCYQLKQLQWSVQILLWFTLHIPATLSNLQACCYHRLQKEFLNFPSKCTLATPSHSSRAESRKTLFTMWLVITDNVMWNSLWEHW